MKKENEYVEHIVERWSFARKTVLEKLDLKDNIADSITVSIFDKCVRPYHYFIGDNGTTTNSNGDPPTEKQIAYAKKLGIKNPEGYTKKTLSDKIDEVK